MKAKLQRQERPKELEEDTSQSTIGKRRRGVCFFPHILLLRVRCCRCCEMTCRVRDSDTVHRHSDVISQPFSMVPVLE
jgi:hypothetical protein